MAAADNTQKRRIKRWILWILSPILLIALIVGLILGRATAAHSGTFYNYESYLQADNEQEFRRRYRYNIFQTVSEFKSLLSQSKAIGGITSDYQAVSLIKSHLIQPINFSRIYGPDFPADGTLEQQAAFLQTRWRPEVWAHLNSFNQYLDGDYYWRYVIPYYLQDRVIAYNVDALTRPHMRVTEEERVHGINFGPRPTTYSIIRTLIAHGARRFSWTDAAVDNAVTGLYYQQYGNGGHSPRINLSPVEITDENVYRAVDGFLQLVADSTGAPLSDTRRNSLISDGLESATRLIDPHGDLDVAMMYNGDALDAYNYEDNFPSLANRTPSYQPIKFVRPVDNMLLVDVVVVSADLSVHERDALLDALYDCIYRGIRLDKAEISQTHKQLIGDTSGGSIDWRTFSDSRTLPWIRNFDYINYTPTHSNYYKFFYDNYFGNGNEVDEMSRSMYDALHAPNNEYNFTRLPALDDQLASKLDIYYYTRTHS